MAAGLHFEQLDREQQEERLKAVDQASPSDGDAQQSAKPATAKQAAGNHPTRTTRRKAG